MTLETERVMVHAADLWRRSLFCGCLSRVHGIQTEGVSGRSREHGVQHLVFGVPAYIPQHQPSLWPDGDRQTLLERHRPFHHFLGIS